MGELPNGAPFQLIDIEILLDSPIALDLKDVYENLGHYERQGLLHPSF